MNIRNYYKDKIIWITGASSGIGRALAIELSSHSCGLILTARNINRLQEVELECSAALSCAVFSLDVADESAVEHFFEENRGLIEKVDIYINNAGISQRSEVYSTDFEVYKTLIGVNLLAAINISSRVLKNFRRQGKGQFVAISSVAGKFGVPLRSGYSASKMGLHGFFDALRAENHQHNISVSIVCPGYIHTDISRNALKGNGTLHGKLDEGQKNGMPVERAAKLMIKGIARSKKEIYVGGFKETKLAVLLSRFFPRLFRKIIRIR